MIIQDAKPGDPFMPIPESNNINLVLLIDMIRRDLGTDTRRLFDECVCFYKDGTTSDAAFIRGLISLIVEQYTKEIRNSSNTEENKVKYSSDLQMFAKGIDSCITSFLNNITCGAQKNCLDAYKLSFILIGYGIQTLKKILPSEVKK
jgi:hypothetical protein